MSSENLIVYDNVLSSYVGKGKKVNIYDEDIRIIGNGAFEGNENITEVEISVNLYSIKENAFKDCTNLRHFQYAFGEEDIYCSIEAGAFSGCKKLQTILIDNSIEFIGKGAFEGCDSLETVFFLGEEEEFSYIEIEEGNECFEEAIIYYYSNKRPKKKGNYWFFLKDKPILWSDNYDFLINDDVLEKYQGKDEKVIVPDTVKKIGNRAFYGNELIKSVVLPKTVTEIGESAFAYCENLEEINLSKKLKTVGNFAFDGCKNLKSVVIPGSLKKLGYCMFKGCKSLESVEISEGVEAIGGCAFYECENLKNISLPESLTTIQSSAFMYCRELESIVIPEGVTELGHSAFADCLKLKSIVLPKQLKTISYNLFGNCIRLSKFVFPEELSKIERKALDDTGFFDKVNWENGSLYLGNILVKVDPAFSGEFLFKNGTTAIAEEAFKGCVHLTKVILPNEITEVSERAFYGCESLKMAVIPDTVCKIGVCAFCGCKKLNQINLPEGLEEIESGAFQGSGLESIKLPSGLNKIASNVFLDTFIKTVKIPEKVTKIEGGAFTCCSKLEDIVIHKGLAEIEEHSFFSCRELKAVYCFGEKQEFKVKVGKDNEYYKNATKYFYKEEKPARKGNFWHYENGEPTLW